MNYLYKSISPTRLYIKQCPHCDLKYFGKSICEDIENYNGSGTRWNNHLKKYKVKPKHLWNSDWYYDTSITRFALKFSRLNHIVEDKKWANLKEENGLEGGFDHLNDGTASHLARARKGGLNSVHNILNKGVMFSTNNKMTLHLSKKANDIKRKKLAEDIEYKTNYYAKVSEYQKNNNSMKDRCWCVPINCISKNKEKKVFKVDQIPNGWVSCKDFDELRKDKSNPAYGKMWIYNTELGQNRYINKNDSIPNGWLKGRRMNF